MMIPHILLKSRYYVTTKCTRCTPTSANLQEATLRQFWKEKTVPQDFEGKVVCITGGSRGFGKAVAEGIAARGGSIVIVSKDATRGEEAVKSIREATKNEKIHFIQGDLSLISSTKETAYKIKDKFPRLDALINNAAVFTHNRVETSEGHELMFATNSLSPFILTNLLLPELQNAYRARVFNIIGPRPLGRANLKDFEWKKDFDAWDAYKSSKAHFLLWSAEFARRITNLPVSVNAFNPKMMTTDLLKDPNASAWTKAWQWLNSLPPSEPARHLLYLLSNPSWHSVRGCFAEGRRAKFLVDFMYWRNHAHKAFFQVAEIADLKSPLTVPFFPTPKGEHFIDNSQEADLFDYINQFFRPKKNKQQNVNDSTTNS